MEEKETISEQPKKRSGVSRRDFIAGTVGGLVVGAVAGAAAGSLGFPKTITQTTTQTQTATTTQTTTSVTTAQPWLPAKWDYSADVVVVGYGGAGACAAINASDAGAKVIVLEKTPQIPNRVNTFANITFSISGGGGNTCICGSGFWIPASTNPPGPGEIDAAIASIYAGQWGTTPMDVVTAFVNEAMNNVTWADSVGIKHDNGVLASQEIPGLPPMKLFEYHPPAGQVNGSSLFHDLDQAVQKRNIQLLFGTPAIGLVQDPTTKTVLGVQALAYPPPTLSPTTVWTPPTSGGTTVYVQAKRAVILCTGGFEFDETMKNNYLRVYPLHFVGWQYNTGDGIRIAQKAGAGLWHMNDIAGSFHPWFPDAGKTAFNAGPSYVNNTYIHVDKYGRRFNREDDPGYGHSAFLKQTDFNLDSTPPEYTRVPLFSIFDQKSFGGGAIFPNWGTGGTAQVLPPQLGSNPLNSTNNQAELAKGWIIGPGNTIADLAGLINNWGKKIVTLDPGSTDNTAPPSSITVTMDPAVLTATVNQYNGYCTSNPPTDLQFGRASSTLSAINTPPYYAVALWPGGPNTQGGPIRNAKGQVCDPDNNPIPRLYSNGEFGSIWGFLYAHGGGDITELMTFGRISGKNAAAETPWTS